MSQSVRHDDVVYLAGQFGDDQRADVATQTHRILAKIDAHLAECGTDKSKLLRAQLWVTDMRNFAAMNEVWDAWIDPTNARCVPVASAAPWTPRIREAWPPANTRIAVHARRGRPGAAADRDLGPRLAGCQTPAAPRVLSALR